MSREEETCGICVFPCGILGQVWYLMIIAVFLRPKIYVCLLFDENFKEGR